MNLHGFPRKLFLKIFRHINLGDILIRHHWVGAFIRLHSFKHKGYWWHGKNREKSTILAFHDVIPRHNGGVVIEIGGHIGYFSLIFSDLVGSNGRVFVFEPGSNNIPYIRRNTANNETIILIEEAVSDREGEVEFYEEDLTGQNNSLLSDYEIFDDNLLNAGVKGFQRKVKVISTTTLDSFWAEQGFPNVDFIKVDVEGAEEQVLRGGVNLISSSKPNLMVEVTRNKELIFKQMQNMSYYMCKPEGQPIEKDTQMDGNVFFFPSIDARDEFVAKRNIVDPTFQTIV